MYKSILVPLDCSELAECSLKHVQAIAQGCHVPVVTLLAVINQPKEIFAVEGSMSQVEARVQEQERVLAQAMDNANKYLAKASIRLSKENINVKVDVVQAPDNKGVADVILEYAENATDLIIMSTHGRSGISRWVLGSVADKVIRSSIVPVLIIASPGCRQ
jgi:nucleotide-binding universal stress UspA family protein